MNARVLRRAGMALVSLALLCFTSASQAVFRAYIAADPQGNDANPCSVTNPCRLLPKALSVVDAGGEVWMLNSANYNTSTVNVTNSVTILAVPGALGSLLGVGSDAVRINTPGVNVTFRNIVFRNFSGSSNIGINLLQGAALTVEDSEIYGLRTGIAASQGNVAIKNTVIRDNDSEDILLNGTVAATIDGAHLLHSGSGVHVVDGTTQLTITNSVITGNGSSNSSSAGVSVVLQVNGASFFGRIERSLLEANALGVILQSCYGAVGSIVLRNNSITQYFAGVEMDQDGTANPADCASSTGSQALLVLDGNAVIGTGVINGFGLSQGVFCRGSAAPAVFTLQNNTFANNVNDYNGCTNVTPLTPK